MTRATTFRATAIIGAVLLAILMIMTVSRAAFTDSTANNDNTWTAGDVSLTDDYTENFWGAMFKGSDPVAPGDFGEECINIIYKGNIDATVNLASIDTGGSSGLVPVLGITITHFDGTDCSGSGTEIHDGLLNDYTADPLDAWAASPTHATESYLVYWELPDTVGNGYQGAGAVADFTWTATS